MDLNTVPTDNEPVYLPWLKGEFKDLSPITSPILPWLEERYGRSRDPVPPRTVFMVVLLQTGNFGLLSAHHIFYRTQTFRLAHSSQTAKQSPSCQG